MHQMTDDPALDIIYIIKIDSLSTEIGPTATKMVKFWPTKANLITGMGTQNTEVSGILKPHFFTDHCY